MDCFGIAKTPGAKVSKTNKNGSKKKFVKNRFQTNSVESALSTMSNNQELCKSRTATLSNARRNIKA